MPTVGLLGMWALKNVKGRLIREAAERAEGGVPLFPASHGETDGGVP